MKKEKIFKPRSDRFDIYNNLHRGDQSKIARKIGCTSSHVNMVLNGRRPDYLGIIKEAEIMAAVNIWKSRFCKYRSQI